MNTPITISKRDKPARQTKDLTIGALIFNQMDQIDFTGPFEVLSRIPNSTIHVIAKTKSPVLRARYKHAIRSFGALYRHARSSLRDDATH